MPMKAILTLALAVSATVSAHGAERVTFPSNDGKTTLTGYLFLPKTPRTQRVPAVVMMHGRAGAYSWLA
jgi:carboxymethylenebutenolidase